MQLLVYFMMVIVSCEEIPWHRVQLNSRIRESSSEAAGITSGALSLDTVPAQGRTKLNVSNEALFTAVNGSGGT